MADILTELRDANDLLRSAHSIAMREGQATNWPAFTKRVEEALIRQSHLLNGTRNVDAATCTPRTFRVIEESKG